MSSFVRRPGTVLMAFTLLIALAVAAWAQIAGDAPPATAPLAMNNEQLDELLVEHFAGSEVFRQGSVWRIPLAELKDEEDGELAEDDNAPSENDPPEVPPADEAPPAAADAGGDENDGEENDNKNNNEAGGADEDDADEGGAEDNDAERFLGPGAGDRLPAVLLVITDETANRMRLMMPIRRFNPNNAEDLQLAMIALQANFDRALDARYAVNDGVLWSVFIHPLGSLTPADLTDAIRQVRSLRDNTGTSYSSGEMLFGGGRGPAPEPQPAEPRDDII